MASNPINRMTERVGDTHPTQGEALHMVRAAGPERIQWPRRHLYLLLGVMMCPRVSHSPPFPGNCSLPAQLPSLTSHGAVLHDGALAPGQGVLEGLEEVKDAPADDDVVVETNKKTDLGGKEGGGHGSKHRAVTLFPGIRGRAHSQTSPRTMSGAAKTSLDLPHGAPGGFPPPTRPEVGLEGPWGALTRQLA